MARPKGSTNKPRDIVDAEPSRCKACGSTRREPYTGTPQAVNYPGTHAGRPYTRIEFRRTRCTDCGQTRIDRAFINEPETDAED